MPGKVKVKIVAGRNLPVMDRSSDTTDAYVEIKLGNTTFKTDVCRKSLNPRWNSEWYRFEVDDSELQDEPLQIRLMDYDTYSANDAIGKVYLDLNPLLLPTKFGSEAGACPVTVSSSGGKSSGSASTSSMSGWIPVYDTMHGIRGEVNVSVKVELFNDFNKFRQSSCGVQFFYSSTIPHGYCARAVHGFVEELVVDDDPEYRWIDKIRTPRASNEARQTLFFKLSGEVRRKIGLKASELGGNAVVGYRQRFDLEGESGIVARGIGTAITLIKLQDASLAELDTWETNSKEERACDSLLGTSLGSDCDSVPGRGHHRTESVGAKGSKSNAVPCMHRRSSDSDLSITPKGNSLSNSDRPNGPAPITTVPGGTTNSNSPYDALIRSAMKQGEMLEYPFLTMTKFPTGFIIHLGGTVSARSVKLLDRACNPDETESRDSWWTELRMEIRSHARALACNVVLGYSEHTSICDDVCVLSASGTAAVANLHYDTCETGVDIILTSIRFDQITDRKAGDSPKHDMAANKEDKQTLSNGDIENVPLACAICHVPYCESSVPFPITMLKCGICRHSNIPDVLITTIELPDESLVTGRGCLIQASVCRPKRDLRGELDAKEISDVLPFLEYDLHRLLINKLKVKGMNAIFGLEVHVSIGERIIVGTATGTGVFLLALPAPSLPMLIVGDLTTSEEKLAETQKLLIETVKSNRETYKVKQVEEVDERLNKPIKSTDIKESEDEPRKLDLTGGDKDSCVLEIDDAEDNELLTLILEPRPPDGFFVVNTEFAPGLDEYDVVENVQTFKQMSRVKLAPHCTPSFGKHFQRLLRTIYFKLRHRAPCTIRRLQFGIDIPEADEIQLTVLGTAIGLSKATRSSKLRRRIARSISKDAEKKSDDIDGIFSLEEDEERENTRDTSESSNDWPIRSRSKSPGDVHTRLLFKSHSQASSRHGIDITSLSFVPGAKIKHYLGNLNFCFIRESTSIREESGPSGFVHGFVADVLAIVRAHITALGGNAMVAYFMTECSLFHNPHKNQGQCLINVGGDVVFVSYFAD